MTEDTKACPFCAEDIKAAAIVCKHCGRDLESVGEGDSEEPSLAEILAPARDKPAANKWSRNNVVGALVLFVVMTSCGWYVIGQSEPQLGEDDAAARAACRHWSNVASDATRGLLTDAELREKIREVYDSGRVSDDSGIALGSERLLASVTSGTVADFAAAADAFGAACSSVDL